MTNSFRIPGLGSLALLSALLAGSVSCSSSNNPVVPPPPPPPPPPAAVASVELSATSATLEISGTTTLTATPRDATGTALTGRTVTWSSSAPAIATVNDGLVTAVSAGLATITATSEGKSGTAAITVNAAPPLSCASSEPTGRLTLLGGDGPFMYTSPAGWRIEVRQEYVVTLRHPSNATFHLEFWGDLGPGADAVTTHENMGGKHIKDRFLPARTVALPDGAMFTLFGLDQSATAGISIYDNDQTHRIMFTEFKVTHSCNIGNFGEANEADGEASSVLMNETGMYWENTHTQGAEPNGTPGPKVPEIQPLGQMHFLNLNQVQDFFDDPRLGHT